MGTTIPTKTSGESVSPGGRSLQTCLHVVGFLDLFGVSMIVPLLNHHVKSLGASHTTAGIIGSCYGVLQLFSSSIVGSWSDVAGRRYSLICCIVVSALGYALLGVSTNIYIYIIARIPIGIFKHSLSISKAFLADLVSETERPLVMGRFNAASSMGFILGPVVGGCLTELPGGFYITSFLCASIFVINAGLVWTMPRADLTRDTSYSSPSSISKRTTNMSSAKSDLLLKTSEENGRAVNTYSAQAIWTQVVSASRKVTRVALSDMWDIFLVRLLSAIAVMLYYSNFSLAMEERFHMTPKMTGYLISYGSALGVLAGFSLGPLSSIYKHNSYMMLLHSSIVTFVSILVYSLTPKMWVVVLSSTFLAFSTTVGRTCVVDIELTQGNKHGSGTLIGVGQSVTSVGRIIVPLFSGIAQEYSPSGPPQIGAILALSSMFLMYKSKSRYSVDSGKRVKVE
ncbi:major facilitator superfamily domain-containing protein 9 [Spea bombifrons]|uniref:major facilitator superfamily domain-containing protein 9 n=1 Tax=Spea bombifrons TaxID=233779 RepID=UPI002348FD99|nr:major facilitator superfamily domain-containing protein 9 [Spea bombifrons]